MYKADDKRYDKMVYRRCGNSGLLLPVISLGIWQNFGADRPLEVSRKILETAFDLGVTHIDMANNYGPPYGSAEETFGAVYKKSLKPYRDELILSSKAGFDMWPGPYGNWGSRKYIMASIDQSLKRTGLEYFDIFYHHRPDPETPIEETMGALADIVKQGKALYVGISNYGAEEADIAIKTLENMGVHCLIHQPNYSMKNRWIEDGLQDVLKNHGTGTIAYCPLAQGILTTKYLNGVPEGARAQRSDGLKNEITPELVEKLKKLNELAAGRGQTLPQMALAWVLRDGKVTSALIGASSPEQLTENVKVVDKLDFTFEELKLIDDIFNA